MSERVEIMRQRAREEAAEALLRRQNARMTGTIRHFELARDHPSHDVHWFSGTRSIPGAGPVPKDGLPRRAVTACTYCGVRSDLGCKHRKAD